MSKSYDFCKTIAQDTSRSSYATRSWDKALEVTETEAIFDELLDGSREFGVTGVDNNGDMVRLNVSISFDANADFDYFTSDSCVYDGTLYFVREAMNRCAQKVCCAQTYYKNIGEPKSGDSLKYVVGNFVVLAEHDGEFVPADKPWMSERATVLLPIKMMKGVAIC